MEFITGSPGTAVGEGMRGQEETTKEMILM